MTFSKYRCHLPPLHKNIKILKLNDIYQFELAKFTHNFTTENCQKCIGNIFKKLLLFILINPGLLIWKITLFIEFQATPVKKSISCGGASLWNKVEQNLKAVP